MDTWYRCRMNKICFFPGGGGGVVAGKMKKIKIQKTPSWYYPKAWNLLEA